MIVATPFAHAPRNRYMDDPVKPKKERVDLEPIQKEMEADERAERGEDGDDSSESELSEYYYSSSESEAESEASVSTQDSDDQEIIDIEKLMKDANEAQLERLRNAVQSSQERMKGAPLPNPVRWVYKKVGGYYNRWYERNRAKRLHPVYREYQKRILEMDAKLKKDFEDQLKRHEAEVLAEAKLRKQRIKRSGMQKKRGDESLKRFEDELNRRNEEARRQEFNCINMQRWAGDNYDRDMRLAAEASEAKKKAEEKAHNDAVKAEIARDNGVIAEDTRITQEVFRQMRIAGLAEGVNVKEKADAKDKKRKKITRQAREICVRLKEDAAHAFKSWEPKYEQTKRQRDGQVFDINLVPLKFLKKVRCSKIGEKGALCLAADFVRGACPQLVELDLSYCQIQTRGFMRLMHGIKIANLSGLTKLNVRGNDIGPRGAETLSNMLNLTIFENLAYIDLRDNELGDRGADIIIHMCLFGLLENVKEINLGNNLISDQGFEALVNVFSASQYEKCPKLQRLGLSGNHVKPETKKKLDPFPLYIQP